MLFVKVLVYEWRQWSQTKDIQYWFIESQIGYLGILRGSKMCLALNEPKLVALHSNSNSYLREWTTNGKKLLILYWNYRVPTWWNVPEFKGELYLVCCYTTDVVSFLLCSWYSECSYIATECCIPALHECSILCAEHECRPDQPYTECGICMFSSWLYTFVPWIIMCIFNTGAKCILLIQCLLPVPEPGPQRLFLPRLGPDHHHRSININLPFHCGACKGDTCCKQQLDCINVKKVLDSLSFHFHCNFFGRLVVVILELVLYTVFPVCTECRCSRAGYYKHFSYREMWSCDCTVSR